MGPKRAAPPEDPPAPSSSSDEEEEEEEAEEEEEESSAEESSGEEEEVTHLTPPPSVEKKTPLKKAVVNSAPQSSSEDEEDESDSESESDSPSKNPRPSTAADPAIKPIATKPMEEKSKKPLEETPKSKRPRSKATASVAPSPVKQSTSKRPSDNVRESKDAKRAKIVEPEADEEESGKKPGEDSKKPLFQRIWSEDDEIALLQGMVDYWENKGSVPYPNGDMNAFYDSIIKYLHIDASKVQLTDKARRLKKKYENNLRKAKSGEDPTFQKPHQQKAFELSKKIWGGEGIAVERSNGKLGKSGKRNKALKVEDTDLAPLPRGHVKPALKAGPEARLDSGYCPSRVMNGIFRTPDAIGLNSGAEVYMQQGLEMLDDSVRAELEEKWRKLRQEEFDLYMKKIELIQMEGRLVSEALKSAQH